tara:strand:+ start:76 stop:702 length:627 start_codon:yes stop_codon:yes gene_type:complete
MATPMEELGLIGIDNFGNIVDEKQAMDIPLGPSFGRPQITDPKTGIRSDKMFDEMTNEEKKKVVQPLVDYHNAMNNVMMSGPAREGRSTILTDTITEDVYPYGTMFPTYPVRPQTNRFDVNFYPGEANQINDFFRNQAGISRNQTQQVFNAGGDPNMTPGLTLVPTPNEIMNLNIARGMPAFPVLVNQNQGSGGLLDTINSISKSLFD